MDEKKKKILWIDDDVNNPELLPDRDALEERGCIITPVTTPDVLNDIEISLYDCIIIDLFLPVGTTMSLEETQYGSRTGFVLSKRIKEQFPKSIIVVYSVFDLPDVREYCNNKSIQYWKKSEYNNSDVFAENIINLING